MLCSCLTWSSSSLFTSTSTSSRSLCVGTIDFQLDKIPRPKAYADKCNLEQLLDWNPEAKWDDLFKKKRVRGWWPVYSDKLGKEYREIKVSGSGRTLQTLFYVQMHHTTPHTRTMHIAHTVQTPTHNTHTHST